jgi:hypothetical protein
MAEYLHKQRRKSTTSIAFPVGESLEQKGTESHEVIIYSKMEGREENFSPG